MSAVRRVSSSPRRRQVVMAVLAATAMAVMALAAPATQARAADVPASIVDGGYLISDAAFFDSRSMTQSQIQTFLDARVPRCAVGKTCLNAYRQNTPATVQDAYCRAIPAQRDASAAWIITQASTACGINPRVLIVMLQKEQGLVTATSPSKTAYDRALGFACPDTPTGCDAAYAGFFDQVYRGARQMQVYTKNPNSFAYRAGRANTIQWDVSRACGTSTVVIKNQATANLYNYTPYRPNIAALAAGYGTGDSCSTYGNRNFYNYYVSWFAPGASASAGAPAQIPACTRPADADVQTRSGTATVNVQSVNVRQAPTTLCDAGIRTLPDKTTVTVTGQYGAWSRIALGSSSMWVTSAYLSAGAPPAPTPSDPAHTTTATTTAALNLRATPTTSAKILATIPRGTSVAVTATAGGWSQVTYDAKTGWVSDDYLAMQTFSTVYSAHVADLGWMAPVSDGEVAGTTGQRRRMEALRLTVDSSVYSGGIRWRGHVENIGWQPWTSGGQIGTTGRALRLEAFQLTLTGAMADHFTVRYRAHVQDIGWQRWVQNGQTAGTVGQAKRIEAVQIELVPR